MTAADIDFYKDDLTAPEDKDLYTAIEVFTRIALPQTERTQEGYQLDFKATWNDTALKAVAAFANTFGGIVVLGISDKDGRADEIVGIPSQRHELKTRVASMIASNISPTPPYEIRDVAFPDGSGRHLCIVRVRKGNHLCLLTKKGELPVYVRNENESIPADSARLQALLATRLALSSTGNPDASQSVVFSQFLFVTQAQPIPDGMTLPEGFQPQRTRSETFLQIRLTPEEPQVVRLDLAVEQAFRLIVLKSFPELADNVQDPSPHIGTSLDEFRLRDWYQLNYRETLRDHEMGWGIDSNGSVYFVTQVRCKLQEKGKEIEAWSLADLITNLDCTIDTAHRLWSFLNYPGEAHILAELRVEPLPLLERAGGFQVGYSSCFYERASPRKRAKVLTTDKLTRSVKHGARGFAAFDLTYATRHINRPEAVAVLANQILRDLGYSATLDHLRSLFS
jgi:Putative DNA-binding domain